MASAPTEEITGSFVDPVLMNAIENAVHGCLAMANISVRCVGVSAIPSRDQGSITGMIGVHGDVTGFVTVNVSQATAMDVVSALLMEDCETLDHQVIDGVGELTNMITGGIKKGLTGTPWAFGNVTVPSIIVGTSYDIAYAQGFKYLVVTFEHVNCKSIMVHDRLIRVATSFIRL